MPRLGSKKTRTGCVRCRQRRVKCDEKRPCSACSRHDLTCSLVSRGESSPPADAPRRLVPIACKTPAASPRAVSQTPPRRDLDTEEINWATDLELMLHYTTEAYLTLPRTSECAYIWQKLAPGFAIAHQYLLRHILAFSALHLAYLRPNERQKFILVATRHHGMGLQQFRAALTKISTNNCHVLFIGASFVIIVHMATLATRIVSGDPSAASVEDMIEIFVLAKGMNTVLGTWSHIIHEGCLKAMFAGSPISRTCSFWDEISHRLQQLKTTLPKREADPSTADILESAILSLADTFKRAIDTAPAPELRTLMSWPIFASDPYVGLLRGSCPGALIILAFYCVIVHETESNTWYSRGWGSKIIQQIHGRLGKEWVSFIQWPLERTSNSAVASHLPHG
ncbi:hypothetical protein GGS24DRAFT_484699 [Hypoxylon argillaceum]|nr:hypothetical protein GGS24DRAFT_484699 [Hypoxylon argillaceum]